MTPDKLARLKREADLHAWLLFASLHEAIQKANQCLAEKEREMSDIGRIARVEVKRGTKRATAKDEHIRQLVRDELATLGGRLLATHGPTTDTPNDVLATLGGYLLTEYGKQDAPTGVWTSRTALTADDALEVGTLDNPQYGESRTLQSGAVVTFHKYPPPAPNPEETTD